jgi:hypothetical protein
MILKCNVGILSSPSPLHLVLIHSVTSLVRRIAAIYGSIAAGIQCVLYADYNLPTDDKHVFTDLQVAYRNWVNRTFFGTCARRVVGSDPVYNEQRKNRSLKPESPPGGGQ